MPTPYELIRSAIQDKQPIRATYNGCSREMCPHTLGRKNGRTQALFYQFGGASHSGLGPPGSDRNWRCIPIDGLSAIEIMTGPWHTAPYSRPQTCIDQIDVQVT